MVDQTDSNKRRLFEISIDSPFRILSHKVTDAITTLPSYSAPKPIYGTCMPECDCSKATGICCATCFHIVPTSESPNRPHEDTTATSLNPELAHHTYPQQLDIGHPVESYLPRPTYLFRSLSFDPPPFEDEGPPLSLKPPPPVYKPLPH